VKRLLLPVLAASLLLSAAGCGNFFVRGAVTTSSTIQGSVSTVLLSDMLNGTGGTVQVTFVTFLQEGTSSMLIFCNDQISLFPLDQTVLVNFNPGQPCATIVLVVPIS
jgi:hypothetical protein